MTGTATPQEQPPPTATSSDQPEIALASTSIASAQVELGCQDLASTVDYFVETLGFDVDLVAPADDPVLTVVSGYGVSLRLVQGPGHPGRIRLLLSDDPAIQTTTPSELLAPNGTIIELAPARPEVASPDLAAELVITENDPSAWHIGRAGMHYRDLIPSRLGGSFIASHIRIPDGGPVPDYVHFHRIHFQMIYCYRGWVKVVYEDQGDPFVMQAGDCVLQPPQIRHRVLEASAGLEVIEIGTPAEHDTLTDRATLLPNGTGDPERSFGGQRFVRHTASQATWSPSLLAGFESRDTGIGAATDGLAEVQVHRLADPAIASNQPVTTQADFRFGFLLEGSAELTMPDQHRRRLGPGASFTIPRGETFSLSDATSDFEWLEVVL